MAQPEFDNTFVYHEVMHWFYEFYMWAADLPACEYIRWADDYEPYDPSEPCQICLEVHP